MNFFSFSCKHLRFDVKSRFFAWKSEKIHSFSKCFGLEEPLEFCGPELKSKLHHNVSLQIRPLPLTDPSLDFRYFEIIQKRWLDMMRKLKIDVIKSLHFFVTPHLFISATVRATIAINVISMIRKIDWRALEVRARLRTQKPHPRPANLKNMQKSPYHGVSALARSAHKLLMHTIELLWLRRCFLTTWSLT